MVPSLTTTVCFDFARTRLARCRDDDSDEWVLTMASRTALRCLTGLLGAALALGLTSSVAGSAPAQTTRLASIVAPAAASAAGDSSSLVALPSSRTPDNRTGLAGTGPAARNGTVDPKVTVRASAPSSGVERVEPDGQAALTNESSAGVLLLADTSGFLTNVQKRKGHRNLVTRACAPSSVWATLEGCGWPGPTNTGHPAGQAFSRTVSGGLVVTTDNTVIDGWKISGGVQVRAKNVVIRNSFVSMNAGGANGSGVVNLNPGSSATIERTTLDGLNATHACVWDEATTMTVTAVDCSRVNDGIFMWATQVGRDGAGDHFVIQDSWLHGFTTQAANGHVDGIQTEGAKHGVIRHNTVDVTQSQTSAIALWNSRKDTDDIVVERNLISGGGFSVYAEDYSPSEASPAGGYSLTSVVFTDNVFSTVHYGCVGSYGVWFPRGAPTDGWKRSGNLVLETGQNLDEANPSYQGRTCN